MFPSPFEIKNSELHREAMLPSVAGKIMSDCLLLYLATLSNTCFMNICRKLSRCTLTKLVVLTTVNYPDCNHAEKGVGLFRH